MPATDRITLYTAQENGIVERLEAGEVHVQPWDQSSAVKGTPRDKSGVYHRPAYEYLVSRFRIRMGASINGAPIFTLADKDTILKFKDAGSPSKLLTLEVPTSEILRTDYDVWASKVLFGFCVHHELFCAFDACKIQSWDAALFNWPSDPTKCQGVLNRIEPDWVIRVE